MKISEILLNAKNKLKQENIDEREARLLLAYALGIRNEDLIRYDDIDDESVKKFNQILMERINHVPFAYLTGHQEFMKLDFKVNKNVLIPRADTETLVYETIDICKNISNKPINILDMCTGSGCIAISLAKYIENSKVVAIDVSEDALKVAKENAIVNNVSIDFIKSDLFENINGKYDVIVSNPPYIKKEVISELEKEVKDNEPLIALDGGEDGLDFYRTISKQATEFLKEDSYLILEIGFDQADDLKRILSQDGYKNIKVIKDYSGNDRVVVASI